MKKVALLCAIAGSFLVLATAANAYSAYDGSWNLVFVTRSGACDATYNFTVDISNGIVTHPNLVKFRGMSPDPVQFARPSLFRINTRRARAGFRGLQAMAAGAGAPVRRCAQAIGRRRGIDGWSQDE